jgi:hypothetical protein
VTIQLVINRNGIDLEKLFPKGCHVLRVRGDGFKSQHELNGDLVVMNGKKKVGLIRKVKK